MTDLHHYCILRKDLDIGALAAQLLHAAGESNPGGLHSFAVALWSNDLEVIEAKLIEAEIPHASIRESDPPFYGELVAIGIHPCIRKENKKLRQIVAGLSLIKEDGTMKDEVYSKRTFKRTETA